MEKNEKHEDNTVFIYSCTMDSEDVYFCSMCKCETTDSEITECPCCKKKIVGWFE